MKITHVKTITPEGSGLLVNRVNAGFAKAGLAFNKGSVAEAIRRDIRRLQTVDEPAPQTRTGAERLFFKLGELFQCR